MVGNRASLKLFGDFFIYEILNSCSELPLNVDNSATVDMFNNKQDSINTSDASYTAQWHVELSGGNITTRPCPLFYYKIFLQTSAMILRE